MNTSAISVEYVILYCKDHPISINTFLISIRYGIYLFLALLQLFTSAYRKYRTTTTTARNSQEEKEMSWKSVD
jgi:hypothetical protein